MSWKNIESGLMQEKIKPVLSYRRNVSTPKQYRVWKELYELFPDEPPTQMQLMLFCNRYGWIRYWVRTMHLKNFLYEDFKIRKMPFATTWHGPPVSLPQHIENLKNHSTNYTVYSFLCAFSAGRLFGCRMTKLREIKLKDYDGKTLFGMIMPIWLKTVIDRQYLLAKNAGLLDDDPLFFVMRKATDGSLYIGKFNRQDLREVEETIEDNYNYNIFDYVNKTRFFYGMEGNSVIFKNAQNRIYYYLYLKHARFSYRTAGLYRFDKGQKNAFCIGTVLRYIDPGIFLVDTIHGPMVASCYLVDNPYLSMQKDQKYKQEILDMGYITQEQMSKMRTGIDLLEMPIVARKLKWDS